MKRILLVLLPVFFVFCTVSSAVKGDKKPVAPKKSATTAFTRYGVAIKVGTLWTTVTNYGFLGDRAYIEPNFEWPGGSGNLYGWLQSIWVGAQLPSGGTVSAGDDNQFKPLDTIRVKTRADGSLSVMDTYTRYTDNNPPNPSVAHRPIGVEVTERCYAWDQSYNDDFIITDYWIKNVGADTTNDDIIDVQRTLEGVYVAFRIDADVSGFTGSSTDSRLWDQDDLVDHDSVNKVFYLYDGDNLAVPGNDKGNPDPITGLLRSPGYIGLRLLYSDSAHFAGSTYTGRFTMFSPTARYNEPLTPEGEYDLIKANIFVRDTVVRDYRGIGGVGPFTIPPGDSIHVVVAWVIGNGKDGLLRNSQVAQFMFDGNYEKAPSSPEEPKFTIRTIDVSGEKSAEIKWRRNAETSPDPISGIPDFDGYAVYKSSRNDAGGNPIWDTLAVYVKDNAVNPATDTLWIGRPFLKSWPPDIVVEGSDSLYRFVDPGLMNGMITTYAITSFDKGDSLLGIGRLENQIGKGKPSTAVYMSNNEPATNTSRIRVVPNPFMGSSVFANPNPIETNPWVNRIRFINLPANSTIHIFTLAGDLVKTIKSGDVVYTSRDAAITGNFSGVAEWDLSTRNNQEAVSGIYIYVVDSDVGSFTGKFVIMR